MDRFGSVACSSPLAIAEIKQVHAALNMLHSNLDGLQNMISEFEARLGPVLNGEEEVAPRATERVHMSAPVANATADAAHKVACTIEAFASILRRLEV